MPIVPAKNIETQNRRTWKHQPIPGSLFAGWKIKIDG